MPFLCMKWESGHQIANHQGLDDPTKSDVVVLDSVNGICRHAL